LDPARSSSLKLRFLSALVMAPVAIAAVWLGGAWFALLVVAAAGIMGWEWARLSAAGASEGVPRLMTLAPPLAALAAALGWFVAGAALGALGSALVYAWGRASGVPERGWAALGTLWIALPCVAVLYLASAAGGGRVAVLWLLAVVWATDIGAYAAGRSIGGPRLAPRLSPNKTWSGALGGIAAAALVGAAMAFLGGGRPPALVAASVGLSVVAQMGDLAESFAKRHFRVKDASGLIPGHGGLLDRLDSVLTAGAAQALLTLVAGPPVWHG
jgi:phosphatidate cytidylyltransferase